MAQLRLGFISQPTGAPCLRCDVMPDRKPYKESCQFLKDQQLLEGDTLPELPERAPRYDDDQLGVSFFRTRLADARLEHLTLPRTFFGRSEIRGVSFRGTDLSQSSGCWNDFVDVDFSEADLSGMDLRGSIFQRVSFRGTLFRGADLRRTSFSGCTLADTDLTGAKLSRSLLWFFRLSSAQRRTVEWHSGPGPEPEEDDMTESPNKSVETNRRPASPFDAGRQFESASCAPASLSAAVAHLLRLIWLGHFTRLC